MTYLICVRGQLLVALDGPRINLTVARQEWTRSKIGEYPEWPQGVMWAPDDDESAPPIVQCYYQSVAAYRERLAGLRPEDFVSHLESLGYRRLETTTIAW